MEYTMDKFEPSKLTSDDFFRLLKPKRLKDFDKNL